MSKTTKSFKSGQRDKPRHSNAGGGGARKGGAGGAGAAGTYQDDVKFAGEDMHALNIKDPNYDPKDEAEGEWTPSSWRPSQLSSESFKMAIANLSEFKKKVRMACEEYWINDDVNEFAQCVKDLDSPIFHQDIPAIVIKLALDQKEEKRNKISALLHNMRVREDQIISTNQMTQGFRKLFNAQEELMTDFPMAKGLITQYLNDARSRGDVDVKEAGQMEKDFEAISGKDALAAFRVGKKKIAQTIEEYFSSEDLDDLKVSVKNLDGVMHFELVKKFISAALDQKDRQRELTSQFLAGCTGGVITRSAVEKALTIVLGRVEDTALDVPNVLELLSKFIARGVADEALTPDFLSRVDLSDGDMGSKVLREAAKLSEKPKAAMLLAGVWGEEFARDDE